MVDDPSFSIIIPTYNRADVLHHAIRSVLNQQYSKFELIIVDDGSSDDTDKVVASFNDKRITYIKKVNEERSIARNTGIDHASGSYITFLDSDDHLYSNHFLEANKFIREADHPEVFHLNYERVFSTEETSIAASLPEIVNELVLDDNQLSCNGVFIRGDIARKFKFIHHRSATYAEDTELWIRLAARYAFHHRPVITSAIRMHNERSAFVVKPFNLLKSILLIRRSLLQDQEVIRYYGKKRVKRFIARRLLLCAVLFSDEDGSRALSVLKRAVSEDWTMVGKKGFFIAIRNLLIR